MSIDQLVYAWLTTEGHSKAAKRFLKKVAGADGKVTSSLSVIVDNYFTAQAEASSSSKKKKKKSKKSKKKKSKKTDAEEEGPAAVAVYVLVHAYLTAGGYTKAVSALVKSLTDAQPVVTLEAGQPTLNVIVENSPGPVTAVAAVEEVKEEPVVSRKRKASAITPADEPEEVVVKSKKDKKKKAKKSKKSKKKKSKKVSSSSSSSDSGSGSDSESDSADQKKAVVVDVGIKRSNKDTDMTADASQVSRPVLIYTEEDQHRRFQRVSFDALKTLPVAMRNNAFDPSRKGGGLEWATNASRDLIVTRGKGFRHQMTKMKRGNYRGGQLDTSVRSLRFPKPPDSDSD